MRRRRNVVHGRHACSRTAAASNRAALARRIGVTHPASGFACRTTRVRRGEQASGASHLVRSRRQARRDVKAQRRRAIGRSPENAPCAGIRRRHRKRIERGNAPSNRRRGLPVRSAGSRSMQSPRNAIAARIARFLRTSRCVASHGPGLGELDPTIAA
ncbi:hypothetical protein WS83_20500 [Burkholderia sp. MSMB2042]|nr:hypothetical protein WS78_11550 [Burkholderia savannae]KVG37436.1 hypothetical protein WS77_01780 [Burkholderia sp. MSMB0265]KVG88299.1 hypothetical protein WS81_25445 [Burkholderia sp. MSMB2040]KVG93851.1 hypothetical protein WS82_08940 [Burkholderia sp. MSMB2041]KVH01102.1 hypothetical protein WS83_20500 [Burkholderia sp. MSMB2042]KVK89882.1 hypothetical protein WS91_27395 [Burkholderia sp. MSMB1498]